MEQRGNSSRSIARGRPRHPNIDEAILRATQRQLGDKGYRGMSISTIAIEAGVTKATIYLRWASKAELTAAAIGSLRVLQLPPRKHGIKANLVFLLHQLQKSMDLANGMSMTGTLLVEERSHPELIALFRQKLIPPRRDLLKKLLTQAQLDGEVRQDVNLDTVVSMLIGSYYANYIANPKVPKSWASQSVETLWQGIAASKDN